MMYEEKIQVPLLAMGMTHGTLRRWLVSSGDRVEIGQPIYQLEIDQGIFEIETFYPGTLVHTGVEGGRYEVGVSIGVLQVPEEDWFGFEGFSVRLTHKMRQDIDRQRGELTRRDWLERVFSEFINAKLKSSQNPPGPTA